MFKSRLLKKIPYINTLISKDIEQKEDK